MGQTKTKGLRIATRCTTIEQFVAAFHRFCDAQTFFISTLSTRPIGLETAFSIELANHTPALRGIGVVVEAWATPKNPFGRPGLQLGIRRLTADSEAVFEELLRARDVTSKTVMPASLAAVVRANMPRPISPTDQRAIVRAGSATVEPLFGGPAPEPLSVVSTEALRTPGSELVLPANPLMGLDDDSLEGFVDCTLYEETANFFPIADPLSNDDPGDPTAEPPQPISPRETPAMIAIAEPLALAAPVLPASSMSALILLEKPRTRGPSGSAIAASLANATAAIAKGTQGASSSTMFGHAPAPPPVPAVRADHNVRFVTEPIADSDVAIVEDRPSLDNMLSGIQAPEVWPSTHRPPGPTADPSMLARVPSRPHADDGFDRPGTPTRWQSLRATSVKLVTGPRRWWVVGGAAALTLTLALVLVIASRSSTADAAKPGDPAHDLVAANTPAPPRDAALPGDHARISKPVADSRVPKADGTATTPPSTDEPPDTTDTGKAPIFGNGPCKIAVSSTPAGSIITVDGEQAGPSPITIGGPCKARKIDIVHPRYQSATRMVTGTPTTEPLEVTLGRPTHDLYVDSQPSGATISIDGHRAGTTPTMVKIMGFTTLTVTVEKPGFKAQSTRLYSKTPHDRQSIKLVRDSKGSLTDLVHSKL